MLPCAGRPLHVCKGNIIPARLPGPASLPQAAAQQGHPCTGATESAAKRKLCGSCQGVPASMMGASPDFCVPTK